MASWVINVHVRWLSKVHSRIKAELLSHDLMHADETTVQVLKEPSRKPTRKSRMWLFCSAKRDTPAYVYEYHETRGKSVAEGFLRGWKGTLTTDGYRPYFNLQEADVTNTACLVHVRRKFAEIVKVAGGDAKAAKSLYPSVALDARRMIDEMFKVDKAFDKLDARERKAKRIEELQPLMRNFYAFCVRSAEVATPRSKLDKALRYAIWSWPYVMNVLDDGRLELDNNIAERGMKVFVIGRKAWLFSDTPRGAEASAAIYSIVTTAKMNGLEPRAYIEWLLTEMPNAGELTDEGVSATAKSAERATLSRRRRPRFPAGGATALWPPALPRAAAQGALDRGVVEVRGPDLNLQRRGALGVPGRDRPARDLPSAELREPDRHRDVLCAERGQPPRGVRGPHDCPLSGSPSPSAASASRSFMR